jgi:hypothetical protein
MLLLPEGHRNIKKEHCSLGYRQLLDSWVLSFLAFRRLNSDVLIWTMSLPNCEAFTWRIHSIASVLRALHYHVRTDLAPSLPQQFSSYGHCNQQLTNFHVATRLRALGTGERLKGPTRSLMRLLLWSVLPVSKADDAGTSSAGIAVPLHCVALKTPVHLYCRFFFMTGLSSVYIVVRILQWLTPQYCNNWHHSYKWISFWCDTL